MSTNKLKSHLRKFEVLPVEEMPSLVPEKVKVSVCIMTYNQKDIIEECINSILRQETTFNYEIIIGDDESNDGTREICIAFAKKHPEKIRLLLHKRENNIKINDRPTGRFNFLYNLLNARGEFIALCEGDDFWIDNFKLTKQVKLIENNPQCTGCFHDFQMNYINSRRQKIQKYKGASEMKLTDFLSKNYYIATSSILFRRSIIDKLPLYITDLFAADFVLKYFILINGNMVHIPKVMSCYNKGVKGSWTQQITNQKKSDKELNDHIYTLLDINRLTQYKHQQQVLDKLDHINLRYFRRTMSSMSLKQTFNHILKKPWKIDFRLLKRYIKRINR